MRTKRGGRKVGRRNPGSGGNGTGGVNGRGGGIEGSRGLELGCDFMDAFPTVIQVCLRR